MLTAATSTAAAVGQTDRDRHEPERKALLDKIHARKNEP